MENADTYYDYEFISDFNEDKILWNVRYHDLIWFKERKIVIKIISFSHLLLESKMLSINCFRPPMCCAGYKWKSENKSCIGNYSSTLIYAQSRLSTIECIYYGLKKYTDSWLTVNMRYKSMKYERDYKRLTLKFIHTNVIYLHF